ncbi:MAG: glycosyltransferase family A protein [Verrucomicrobia bacterium]|nr:glycosyltransferase family A protein [Verrucomicrobiota bacterium]
MTSPLVSCIVPVYNGERYLAETLTSIVEQTYSPMEVIVVDDGSTDGTENVVKQFGSAVKLVRQENAGTPTARNTGILHSLGEFIGFLDADDLWHPEKIARQISQFASQPGLQLSFTYIQNYWSPEISENRRTLDENLLKPLPGYVCPTMLLRRELLDTIGLFDVALQHASEPEWILKAASLSVRIALLPEVLVRRRLHATSRSAKKAKNVHDEYLHLLKTYLDRKRSGIEFNYDFRSHAKR